MSVRESVVRIWLAFTESFEGGVPTLYNDVRGMTTIAYGNLVNSSGAIVGLPFVHPDGTPATAADKVAAWEAVHSDPQCKTRGWRYAASLPANQIRLTRQGMADLALGKLASNHADLVRQIPDLDDMPACAAMAMHSLAWACGSRAHFPALFAAVNARDFASYTTDSEGVERLTGGAAHEIHMNEWTPEGVHNAGLVPRNIANKILMRNAQRVQDCHLDPDLIEWLQDLGASEAPTVPALPESSPIIHALSYGDEPPDDPT